MRRLAPVIGALVVVAISWVPAQAMASQETMASLANRERTTWGLGGLTLDAALSGVAARHAAEMARTGRLFHNPSLAQQVAGWQVIGENVGRGATLDHIHTAFMASSPHRAHILGSRYNAVGIGVVVAASGVVWVDEIFVSWAIRAPAPPVSAAVTVPPQVRLPPATARTGPPAPVPAERPPVPVESPPPPPAETPPVPAASVQAHPVAQSALPPPATVPSVPLVATALALLSIVLGGHLHYFAGRGNHGQ